MDSSKTRALDDPLITGLLGELVRAIAASGPGAPKPTPVESFLAAHPKALEFVQAPKPIPTSFAREAFFAVTAFGSPTVTA